MAENDLFPLSFQTFPSNNPNTMGKTPVKNQFRKFLNWPVFLQTFLSVVGGLSFFFLLSLNFWNVSTLCK